MMERQQKELGGMLEVKIDKLSEKSTEIADKLDEQDERIKRLEKMRAAAPDVPSAPGPEGVGGEKGDARRSSAGTGREGLTMADRRDLFLTLQLTRLKGSGFLDELDSIAANDRGPGPSSGMIEPARRERDGDQVFAGGGRADG